MKKILAAVLVLGLVLSGVGYFRYSQRRAEGETKYTQLQSQLGVVLKEVVDLYSQRTQYLLDWQAAVEKSTGAKNFPKELEISEALRKSTDLKVSSTDEAARFDFVQNQISQLLGVYLQSKPAQKVKPPGLEKIEEAINRKRHAYHVTAFEAEQVQKDYRLNHPAPLIFAPEKILKEKGLF
jgi:hypothetical protein